MAEEESLYMHAEPGDGVHAIEVARDRGGAPSNLVRSVVETDWHQRANELCPDGIKATEFKFIDPTKAYFEELRCDSPDCQDRIVGQGYVECE